MNISTIALMPCNPSIGGPGKGHLIERSALLGETPMRIDETCITDEIALSLKETAALRSRRAQADKYLYRQRMLQTLFNTRCLTLRQGHVTEIIVENEE